jgi:hypothetical protein
MLNNNKQTADITEQRKSARPNNILSRCVKQCCPFLTRARFYKTQSLKDKKLFSTLNGDSMEKKRKINDEIDEHAGTSMMYYL